MIVDSHAHLDMPQFDADRDEVIQRARDAGLDFVITIATGRPGGRSVENTLGLVEKHDFLYAGLGVHPHDAGLVDSAYFEKLERWTEHPKVVLWGEIGLDYYYNNSPREIQMEVFSHQLRVARRRNLPVSIHCRDAWHDLIRILGQEWGGETPGGILHSFTGTKDQALEGASMGFLISFSGIVTFKNSPGIKEAARELSLNHILVETDCPYLAPVPHRGKRNEPAFVVEVAHALAQTKQIDFQEVIRHTSSNIRRLISMEEEVVLGGA